MGRGGRPRGYFEAGLVADIEFSLNDPNCMVEYFIRKTIPLVPVMRKFVQHADLDVAQSIKPGLHPWRGDASNKEIPAATTPVCKRTSDDPA